MRTDAFTTILNKDLTVMKRLPTDDEQDAKVWPQFASSEIVHCNVDRGALREIVLMGLEEVCHFGKKLMSYESNANGVTALFADGTSAHGDVLIGGDGIRSPVRLQRAPELHLMDAGLQAIYGRVPYSAAQEILPPEALGYIFSIAWMNGRSFSA